MKKGEAVYVGRRFNGPDICQAFDAGGKDLILFSGIRGLIIGCSYELSVGPDGSKMSKSPKRTGAEPIANAEWDAKDAVVEDYLREKRAERKVKELSRPAHRAAVDALRPLIAKLGPRERQALVLTLMEDAE